MFVWMLWWTSIEMKFSFKWNVFSDRTFFRFYNGCCLLSSRRASETNLAFCVRYELEWCLNVSTSVESLILQLQCFSPQNEWSASQLNLSVARKINVAREVSVPSSELFLNTRFFTTDGFVVYPVMHYFVSFHITFFFVCLMCDFIVCVDEVSRTP